MKCHINPQRNQWDEICRRPSSKNPEVSKRVIEIIDRVKCDGDKALRALSLEIDGCQLEAIAASSEETAEAGNSIGVELRKAIAAAAENIRAFHAAQMPQTIEVTTAPGVRCIQKPVAISKVGLYIPGGTAPLLSTVLMLAIPAKLAGCKETVLCTPCGRDGKVSEEVLFAAKHCGVDKVFKVGGAQAIAAMAYGTESIPKVDKIFGPGNQYVTTAKQLIGSETVAIDMPAGPSEVMVIADSSTEPSFVAADLLSQAEHGRDSQVMLVCDNEGFVEKVEAEISIQSSQLGRSELVQASLLNSNSVVFDSTEEMVDFADHYAPEHLIVSTSNPWTIASKIRAAGSIFIGKYSPESAGDYASGTNHTLPTCAWAKSYSGVNLDSFMRKMTIQEISKEGLAALESTIVNMAEAEGLQAHANAVKIRLKQNE